MRQVVAAGLTSFKIYMAYDGIRLTDAEMLLALDAIAAQGALAIVHAENHAVIMHLVAKELAAGHVRAALAPAHAPGGRRSRSHRARPGAGRDHRRRHAHRPRHRRARAGRHPRSTGSAASR